jgi:Amt family ammonium transporter
MVNITYDSCESSYSLSSSATISLCTAAGDLNWYDAATGTTVVYNLGDIAWVIAATALVWIMIPGVGFFYSGLLRRKNALSMIWLSMMTLAVVSFQVSFLSLSLAS